MPQIEIILPDKSSLFFSKEPTVLQVAEKLGPRLAQDTVGAYINGQKDIIDLRAQLHHKTEVHILTLKNEESNEVIRHSAAHLMAEAVQSLWPSVQVTIGPVIETGFYYDFYSPDHKFSQDDLEKIENKMKELIKEDRPIVRKVVSQKEAIRLFKKLKEDFKVEIIKDLGEEHVSIYHQGDWFDLCRGPHVQKTGDIKAFKLLSVAGSYWRGDENKDSLQRIYGTAFKDSKSLQAHLFYLEEAKKRDHRKIGKDLDLFFFNVLSSGTPFFKPKGTIVYNELQGFIRDMYRKYGYQEVITPQIFEEALSHQSGHYTNYKENMYFVNDGERDFFIKPMNCPGHCLIYKADKHSYRDLPLRIADFGRLHRNERKGVIQGLMRVKSFCQDDAHVFCRMDQLQQEIRFFMEMLDEIYQALDMTEYKVCLSTRPQKRMGSDEVWDEAEKALQKALEDLKIPYRLDKGEGAFYGPKLDIIFVDSLKRSWQLGTLQCDFNLPKAFQLEYQGQDNEMHKPVMLHRAVLGSIERFMGVYLEHTEGRLPLWLSPVQVAFMNISEKQMAYAQQITKMFLEKNIRIKEDFRNEKLGFKIREAQVQKVPYMVIIGDEELKNETLSVRLRDGKNQKNLKPTEFLNLIEEEIQNKK